MIPTEPLLFRNQHNRSTHVPLFVFDCITEAGWDLHALHRVIFNGFRKTVEDFKIDLISVKDDFAPQVPTSAAQESA